jgi:phytoene dehydrogenase-like protein
MSTSALPDSADIVIVGGGHNGLVAAAYLAKAGKSVLLLERLGHTGGAAVSAQAFSGRDARLSRYSYLVSLLPRRIIDDLGLDITLLRRRYSSYTPLPGTDTGLLIDTGDPDATAASFASIGAEPDAQGFANFQRRTARLAETLWPSMTEPLMTRSEARALVGDDAIWDAFIERPISGAIEADAQNDLVRGVLLTDALIGTFARASDDDLAQNRCFLYHVIGGGTGDWDVPVGGMGAVSGALWHAATEAGATIVTGAEVTSLDPDGTVTLTLDGERRTVGAGHVLSNVAPWVLDRLLGEGDGDGEGEHEGEGERTSRAKPEGAQVKVNLLLSRLPRLRDDTVSPEAAFGGTFHIHEGYAELDGAVDAAEAGGIPSPLPAEIYCHSLTDPSILSPELQASGAQTLTVFGLHVPSRLVTEENNDEMRDRLQGAVLESLNGVLAEPIEGCLLLDDEGRPCIETKTTLDIERALGMPGGNIFHGPVQWPFVEDASSLESPAERWGVSTGHDRILLCGSGARRGGAVSGLGGHNAAMAVLELLS